MAIPEGTRRAGIRPDKKAYKLFSSKSTYRKSLFEICLQTVVGSLDSLQPSVLKADDWNLWEKVWQALIKHNLASLDLFCLFCHSFGPRFTTQYSPLYCVLPRNETSIDGYISSLTWGCPESIKFGVVFTSIETQQKLLKHEIFAIARLKHLAAVDLAGCTLSVDTYTALRKSLEFGTLSHLVALCLPSKGPASLKEPLARTKWPDSLEYLETPVRPGHPWHKTKHKSIAESVQVVFDLGGSLKHTIEPARSKAYIRANQFGT